jgi:hypothetical protein
VRPVIAEIGRLEITDRSNPRLNEWIEAARSRLQRLIQQRLLEVGRTLAAYDDAFERLTHGGEALAFREFLLNSPGRFLQLGERIGAIAHVTSFWRYRFPTGALLRTGPEDLLDLLEDFESGLSQPALDLAA